MASVDPGQRASAGDSPGEDYRSAIPMAAFEVATIIFGYLSFIRLTAALGASEEADALAAAMTVPNLATTAFVFWSGRLLIPYLVEREGAGRLGPAVRLVLTRVALLAVPVVVLAFLLAPLAVPLFAPGLSERGHELAVSFARLALPGVALLAVNGALMALLQSASRYRSSAFAASVNALVRLLAVLLGVGAFGGAALAAGFTIAQVVSAVLLIGAVFVYRLTGDARNPASASDAPTKEDRRAFRPVVRGLAYVGPYLALEGVTTWAIVAIASGLAVGNLAAWGYAGPLYAAAVIVLTRPLVTITTRQLSTAAQGGRESWADVLGLALRLQWLVALLGAALLAGGAYPLIETLYARGAFAAEATELTAAALTGLAFALPGHALQTIVVTALWVRGEQITAITAKAVSTVVIGVLAWPLAQWLGVGGVTLAFGIGYTLEAAGITWVLHRRGGLPITSSAVVEFGRTILAGGAALGVAFAVAQLDAPGLLSLPLLGAGGIAAYVLVLWALGASGLRALRVLGPR